MSLVTLGPDDWPNVVGEYCVVPRSAHEDWESAKRIWSEEMAAWGFQLRKIDGALVGARSIARGPASGDARTAAGATAPPAGRAAPAPTPRYIGDNAVTPRLVVVQADLFGEIA